MFFYSYRGQLGVTFSSVFDGEIIFWIFIQLSFILMKNGIKRRERSSHVVYARAGIRHSQFIFIFTFVILNTVEKTKFFPYGGVFKEKLFVRKAQHTKIVFPSIIILYSCRYFRSSSESSGENRNDMFTYIIFLAYIIMLFMFATTLLFFPS